MKTYEELKEIMDADPLLFNGLCPLNELAFKEWLPDNMHIYHKFVDAAMQLRTVRNRRYYSTRTIWEYIRWQTIMTDKTEQHYKLNNNTAPFVSWLVMKAEPGLDGMFVKRKKK